jgi:hypothetical protein
VAAPEALPLALRALPPTRDDTVCERQGYRLSEVGGSTRVGVELGATA